jgi:hypothetical protein
MVGAGSMKSLRAHLDPLAAGLALGCIVLMWMILLH